MEPLRDTRATLVDLLDRVLDKGIMLDADLMITMAGIPLIGIKLKAAIAGIETMLEYGMWNDWDEAQRAYAAEEWRRKEKGVPLLEGEEVILKMFGSHWYSKGIYRNWRPGHLYVTTERVLLYRKEPAEILFEASYENIEGFAIERKANIAKKESDYLYIFLNTGEAAWLHPMEVYPVKEAIEGRMNELGLSFERRAAPVMDENAAKFLMEDEEIVHSEKMWYLLEHPAPGSERIKTWKSGKLYLTNKRVCWWYDFDECVAFECRLEDIIDIGVETKDLGGMLKEKRVLVIEKAYFSGNEEAMRAIEKELNKRIKMTTVAGEVETETCPSCGRRAPVIELLNEGCNGCGWMSPRLKLKKKEILVQ